MQQQLEESGEPQISTSDPESRQLMTRNNISEVAYSVQTVVDAKHNLPIDYKVTNQNDTRALSDMLRRTKTILGTNDFTALYDKGYHTGCEIKAAVTAGIDIMVAIPGASSFAPDDGYNMDQFIYNEHNDTYSCPQGEILTTNGNEYQKNTRTNSYAVKHYNTNACQSCPARSLCTKSLRGRLIERSEFTPYIEQNRGNIASRPELYKQRQSIVEHPYGTIKRQWGFYYIITLAEIYDRTNTISKAYHYSKLYRSLNDSLAPEEYKRKLSLMQIQNELEIQTQQAQLLNKENQLKEQQLKRGSLLRNILFGGIGSFLVFSFIIFRNISLKRKNEVNRRKITENDLQLEKFESEKSKAELEKHAIELEMQSLRAQMNPHFIFNCLSSINGFILKNDTEPASEYLVKFSKLIRMVLTNSKKEFITLEDEFEMLRLYLEMERLRFQYSFDYKISFQNEIDPENIFLPPLLLQPFAENAIWHGLMHKKEKGHLEIAISLEKKILTCKITDNGIGRNNATLIKSKSAVKQKSMGLQITKERLALLNRDIDVQTFFEIEDIIDDKGNAAGTRVILKMHYKDIEEFLL